MLIFYGTGLRWGTSANLLYTELIEGAVYCIQQFFSNLWLRWFRFGPLEWIWRMLTYGHWIKCRKSE